MRPESCSWTFGRRRLVPLTLVFVLCVSGTGCASSRSAEEIAKDRAAILGIWEYYTEGVSVLQRGTFRVRAQGGDLMAHFQDSWRGQFEVDLDLRGSRMEFEIDRLRISGQVLQGEFSGSIRRPLWDVSRESPHRQSIGYFEARRVRSSSGNRTQINYGCPSLLREASYICSPLTELTNPRPDARMVEEERGVYEEEGR